MFLILFYAACTPSNILQTADLDSFTLSIASGDVHNCKVDTSGNAECWGGDSWGQSTVPSSSFLQVSAGD